jgi:8-oxo-dGTP diphosphatase
MIIMTVNHLCHSGERVLQTQPPPNFLIKAQVAAILPLIEDKVLLLQRLPTHPQANLWCVPGGKIHATETPVHAAIRELQEETGIVADPEALIDVGKYYVRYPNGDFVFYLFKLDLSGNDINVRINEDEHQAYCLCPLEEAKSLPLTPGLDECFELALTYTQES